jgi:hypothetical protein
MAGSGQTGSVDAITPVLGLACPVSCNKRNGVVAVLGPDKGGQWIANLLEQSI